MTTFVGKFRVTISQEGVEDIIINDVNTIEIERHIEELSQGGRVIQIREVGVTLKALSGRTPSP